MALSQCTLAWLMIDTALLPVPDVISALAEVLDKASVEKRVVKVKVSAGEGLTLLMRSLLVPTGDNNLSIAAANSLNAANVNHDSLPTTKL